MSHHHLHDSSFGSPNEIAKNTDDEELEVDLDVVEMTLPILTVHIANSLQLYNNVFTMLWNNHNPFTTLQ